MLKKRIIPKLQMSLRQSYRGPRPVLVVTRNFESKRAIGDPLSQAKIYEAQLADELIFVDLERTEESWSVMLSTLSSMSSSLATPLAVGGGITRLEQVQELLDKGADKIILNSAAVERPQLITDVANKYGSQCIIVSIDARRKGSAYTVLTECGSKDTGYDPIEWGKRCAEFGAGEIMITSIEHDGTSMGLDLRLIENACRKISVPIIGSGGCGLSEHFVKGFDTGASAIGAGSFFSQKDQNPMQCRSHVRNGQHPIRLEV